MKTILGKFGFFLLIGILFTACSKEDTVPVKESAIDIKESVAKEENKGKPSCVGEYNKETWTNCIGERNISDGSSYKGEYLNGKASGQGVYTFADGTRYEGNYLNGKRNGGGKEYFADGRLKIDGWWEDGKLVNASPESIIDDKPVNLSMTQTEVTKSAFFKKGGAWVSESQYQTSNKCEEIVQFHNGNFMIFEWYEPNKSMLRGRVSKKSRWWSDSVMNNAAREMDETRAMLPSAIKINGTQITVAFESPAKGHFEKNYLYNSNDNSLEVGNMVCEKCRSTDGELQGKGSKLKFCTGDFNN